jgi:HSP20 family protein
MAETIIAPNMATFSDDKLETLNIQIELPGVNEKDIDLRFFEDGFYIVAKKEGIKFMGYYALVCPVRPDKAIAEYADGLLIVNVPYKEPLEEGVKVKID